MCRRVAGTIRNAKQTDLNDTRPLTNSVVVLQEPFRYKAPSKHHIKS